MACLTSGFELVARRPRLAAAPLLLDLFLWLGPRLSVAPLLGPAPDLLRAGVRSADMMPAYQLITEIVEDIATRYNLFVMASPAPLLGIPTLMSIQLPVERPMGIRPDLPVLNLWGALGWSAILIIFGMGLSAFYLQQIGRHVAEETETPAPGPPPLHRLWGQLLQMVGALILLAGGALITVSLVVAIMGAFSPALAGLFTTLFISIVVFILVHVIYAVPSMVQMRRLPLKALQESVILTRVDFPGTTGLLLALLVLSQGLNFVWTLPEAGSWATLVGIGGHAFVSTALTAALFIFYQERLAYLRLIQGALAAKAA